MQCSSLYVTSQSLLIEILWTIVQINKNDGQTLIEIGLTDRILNSVHNEKRERERERAERNDGKIERREK